MPESSHGPSSGAPGRIGGAPRAYADRWHMFVREAYRGGRARRRYEAAAAYASGRIYAAIGIRKRCCGGPPRGLAPGGEFDPFQPWRVRGAGDPAALRDGPPVDLLDVAGEVDRGRAADV